MRTPRIVCLLCLVSPIVSPAWDVTLGEDLSGQAPTHVRESARGIPVAYRVDVAVVGGTTGAVAAAVEAARQGSTVFLAAPEPYLGEDMTATLRLWLEEGETPESPLARAIFSSTESHGDLPPPARRAAFTYEASLPSAGAHRDTVPPSLLGDGLWGEATRESVQYDGDVEILLALAEEDAAATEASDLAAVHVLVYHANDFQVDGVAVSVSDDGRSWRDAGGAASSLDPQSSVTEPAIPLSVTLGARARHLKVAVRRAEGSGRLLLGEIIVERAGAVGGVEAGGLKGPGDGTQPPRPAPLPRPAPPTPLHVKKALDDALLDAGVRFLYSSRVTDLLVDGTGTPAGVVIANRAGRQAVVARVTVDATEGARVAELAGAWFDVPDLREEVECRRTVIGGAPVERPELIHRTIEPPYRESGKSYAVIEYTLRIPAARLLPPSWQTAEQVARDLTFQPDQEFAADRLFVVPASGIQGQARLRGEWPGVAALDLGALRPRGVSSLLVLGGRAGVPRTHAARLLRPLALIDLGARVGAAAAREAKDLPDPESPRVRGSDPVADAARVIFPRVERLGPGEVRETLVGVRPIQDLPVVPQEERSLPILGAWDVVVVGGGTSGAPAAIGAARAGARVLVLEHLHGLGGVGTLGAITSYYWGNRVGFSATVEGGASWGRERKAEWWRRSIREAGGEIWFGVLACGAVVEASTEKAAIVEAPTGEAATGEAATGEAATGEAATGEAATGEAATGEAATGEASIARGGRVRGVVVATPGGRGAVLAKAVIDATGNADVAAAAGAACITTDASDIALQGTGLPALRLGRSYTNTDWTIVDETDMLDVWRTFVSAKHKAGREFDLGKLIDTRERRRIVGDLTIGILDAVNGRTYPDTVVECYSDFDTHGYTVEPYFTLEHPPAKKGFTVRVPYRSMLPRDRAEMGLDGIIVVGLGTSAHRDAVPLIRMQPDLQNQGYAAGAAAAMAAREGRGTRDIDVRALQRHLVAVGNLKDGVLAETDSYPLSRERIEEAVRAAGDGHAQVSVILAFPDAALPFLREAYAREADAGRRLVYAHILAVIGDRTGVGDLIAAVEAAEGLDEGWRYTGMGQFGPNMSPLDRWIYALGRAGDRRAVPAILGKLRLLEPGHEFSHFRAMALALEMLGDPAATGPLADLLGKPGVRGHATDDIRAVIERERRHRSWNATEPRSNAIRELILGRALFLCGDRDGLGNRILEEYRGDLRGHLSRHADAVLRSRETMD